MTDQNPHDLFYMLKNFPKLENVFNPLSDYDPLHDISDYAPEIRFNQLKSYIKERIGRAKVILVAEAMGYAGAKFSGIAMTDERVLLGQKPSAPFKPNAIIAVNAKRTSNHVACRSDFGMNEMTASVLYKFLHNNGIDPRAVVTWNTFPFHPHVEGNLLTNRAPKIAEIEAANHIQREFFSLFSECKVVSIGNFAAELMDELGIACQHVRHPAFGGARIFTAFMESVMDELNIKTRNEVLLS